MTRSCRLCGEPVEYFFICKPCRIKTSKLTFIKDIYKHYRYGKIGLYRCECGTEFPVSNLHYHNGYVRSCGCIKNQDKKNLLQIDEIPKEFIHLVKLNTSSESLGNQHHRQWGSIVQCLLCDYKRWLRNERIRLNIKRSGIPYICQPCGGCRRG